MPIALLTTKLFIPPPRPGLVARPHLLEKLDSGLNVHHRLLLISAPAGFGKTTLLSTWLDRLTQRGVQVGWVQLDKGDNDRVRFLSYIIAALQTLDANLGQTAQALLHAPLSVGSEQASEAAVAALLNDLADSTSAKVIVLDDYHTIIAQPVHEALTFLIDHLPPHVQLVVAGRTEPPLSLARLRAMGQLTEIRAFDLRFTLAETTTFLNDVRRIGLTADQIAALDQQAAGWIVGLQLAALSMQGRRDFDAFLATFGGRNRYVLDYLIEEVLERQPANVQDFLVRTSISDRLTGSLCDALTDRADGAALLQQLEQANLFIDPLDQERTWYRYHPLFAEFLRSRLSQQRPTGEIVELHRRASLWHEQHGLWNAAVSHALQSQDFDRAARLIEQTARDMWITRGESGTLLEWITALPADTLYTYPHLLTIQAWALMADGQSEAAAACAQEVLNTTAPEHTDLIGEAEAILTIITALHNNMPRTIELAQRALDHLPVADRFLRGLVALQLGLAYEMAGQLAEAGRSYEEAAAIGNAAHLTFIRMMAATQLADLKVVQGQLRTAATMYQQTIQLSSEPDKQLPIISMVYSSLGRLLYEWNDLEQAERTLHDSIKWGQRWAAADIRSIGLLYLAYIRLAQQEPQVARDLMQQAEHALHDRLVSPLSRDVAQLHQARLALLLGDINTAQDWATNYQQHLTELPAALRITGVAVVARVWLAQGQADRVCELIGPRADTLESAGLIGSAIEYRLLYALALRTLDRSTEARSTLRRALTLAEAGGYVRLFIDEGNALQSLLSELRSTLQRQSDQRLLPYLQKLLAAFPAPLGKENRSDVQQLIEPLSERELEVLRLIADGYSNQEIAARLIVALSTIKTHINNIYGKLGVQSRTQALARARALHLL
jgi:LuxR family transcriptional regulator, maltose regulon positive regulatory protein